MKNLANIIKRPHITEKATRNSEVGVYVFEIFKNSSKKDVAQAIKEQYKVTPVKVTTVTIPAKTTFVRGKKGTKSSYKKAYVYLKKGDKIEII
jgi:large subunit ribosomal protein L23